ncbi:MAG: rRNA pseudouridine synthase [Proteobacteria bacterium]|nr:rRNA pseudouridine synthase [Pseudomonadota bacterium]
MKTRLAKFISDSGAASRRGAEALIESGRVSVNKAIVRTPVFFVDETDAVAIDGQPIRGRGDTRVFAFNKPVNTVTSAHDPDGRRTIYDVLKQSKTTNPQSPAPSPQSLKYIGRLDYKTTGLLLLTNDGELARKLTLPSSGIARTYIAKLRAANAAEIKSTNIARNLRKFLSPMSSDDAIFDAARRGVAINGVKYAPMEIEILSRYPLSVKITLREGKKNEIRIVMEHLGLPVSKLQRISFGPIELGNLSPGDIRELSEQELKDLTRITLGANPGPAKIADFC